MASFVTNRAKAQLQRALLDLATDANIKILLVGTTFDGTVDDDFVGGITTLAELSGTGYVAGFGGSGRKVLASKTVTEDDTNDKAVFDAADVTWTAINAGTVHGGVIFKKGTTTDADAEFIAFIQLTSDLVTNGGDFTFQFATGGIISLT